MTKVFFFFLKNCSKMWRICVHILWCIEKNKINSIHLLNQAVATSSYPNLFNVAGVTNNHKSGSWLYVNKIFGRVLFSRILQFFANTKLFMKEITASLRKNQHSTLHLNSSSSVTLHLTVSNTLFQSS